MTKKVCLNMIVRNEIARVERCLKSVADHIDYYVIVDTGSTDGTVHAIEQFFDLHGIPGEIHKANFKNFEQARNVALSFARGSHFRWDYLLLMDADMQLVVEDKKFRDKLSGTAYDVIQRGGALAYHNTRLIRNDTTGKYVGVTHEFLNVPGSVLLEGIWFIDHADGSNRKEKYIRDIALLKGGLQTEPGNGRYWFYLAQSYRDAGMWKEAADAYERRMHMHGWDEEAWNARLNYGACLLELKDESGFIREMLAAYNQRPARAEPLYDLSKFYRDRSMYHASLLCMDTALKIPYPNDMLFVNEWVYKTGLRLEFSISAFYDQKRRASGFKVCNELAIDKNVDDGTRALSRSNLFHYLEPLSCFAPSFKARELNFLPPRGYTAMNPSVASCGDQIVAIVRAVNYTIDKDGQYKIGDGDGAILDSNPIRTRNYLLMLNNSLDTDAVKEILPPVDMPPPTFKPVLGFEDMRLFYWRGGLWCSSTVREMNQEGWCEQVLANIARGERDCCLESIQRMLPPERRHEKNWMPKVVDGELLFQYDLGTLAKPTGELVKQPEPALAINDMRGGAMVEVNGGWLAIIHEAQQPGSYGSRSYQHRFAWFNESGGLEKVSLPFVFNAKQIEFAAGLAWHPDAKRLLISYGVRDKEAWIATVDVNEVLDFVGAP